MNNAQSQQAIAAALIIVGTMIFASLLVGIQGNFSGSGVQTGSVLSSQAKTCNDVCSDARFDLGVCKDQCSQGENDYGSGSCFGVLTCCCHKY